MILTEVVDPSFRMPDLPKYDGTKDPQEHIAAFELVMNLYGQSSAINAKLFVTTLTGKAQEWFTSLPGGGIETFDQDLLLLHWPGIHRRMWQQLMRMAQKYIDEEEINAMKDGEWQRSRDRGRWKNNREKHVRADKEREPPYRPRFHRYTPLATTRTKTLLMVERSNLLQWLQHTRFTLAKRFSNKYCKFHKEKGHDTEDCYQLKDEIERLVTQGYFKEFILEQDGRSRDHKVGDRTRSRSRSRERFKEDNRKDRSRENVPVKGVINTIAGGSAGEWSNRERKRAKDLGERRGSQDDPMVIKLNIANFSVHKVMVDNGSSADIIFWDVIKWMGLENAHLDPVRTLLVGFESSEVASMGTINLPVSMGEEPRRKTMMVRFLVVDTPFAYNVILGRLGLNAFKAVVSTYHLKMKSPTKKGIGEPEKIEPVEEFKTVELIAHQLDKVTRIGSGMSNTVETMMIEFLRKNVDMFAWSPSDFKGIDPEVIVQRLNMDPMVRLVKQKKRSFGAEQNRIIEEEVKKLLKAGYVSEVQYTNWLANVVVAPKASGKWHMCTDFTNLNKAYPKDPYPFPRIDLLVDSTAGYEFFSMMDAYQGFHQIFMAEEDRIKTLFITDQGIYCYNVMPFSLKNAYQRLVNRMFKNQIGSTMEVYVDDMLVKSKEGDHLKELGQAFEIMRA
ncbi:UNVERIFIED_CONTAM: hypothetical protein Sradi_2358400 [Sesamum radiatum]|uniref:Reverse transcriptase domain-containing protein n=1 Tax=Sesamum radiatum TaxID=300843 RepID=A0AAW2T8W5_SESRA